MAVEERLSVAPDSGVFNEIELDTCDEPVKRYFRSAIAPGSALARAAYAYARLDQAREPFRAEEVLAPLHGYFWPAVEHPGC